MTNGSKLPVIESATRMNDRFPPASGMVISPHCLICDSRGRVLHGGCQTITSQVWEALGQYIQSVKLWVIFMFICSPYYFLWLSKISITLGSGTENVLWAPEAYILLYFYYFLWWPHYSLMPECFSPLFVFPSSPFSTLFSGFSIYLLQLHDSEFMPFLPLSPSEQWMAPRLLDFTGQLVFFRLPKRRDWLSLANF